MNNNEITSERKKRKIPENLKYCRTCYDHLAGYVGVQVIEALEKKALIRKSEKVYVVSEKGWDWFAHFNIYKDDFIHSRRPLTRQCIDWTERRPHLAGQLGAVLLDRMLQKKWFKRIPLTRELAVTSQGKAALFNLLGISV